MIIIKDNNEEGKSEMRSYMRSRMRKSSRSHGYRTSTTHYKDEDLYKEAYEHGWRDCEKEMDNDD